MNVELVKSYQVEAAHTRPVGNGPERLHGHSYLVDIVLSGECDAKLGWLMDYAEVTARFDDLYSSIDHKNLDDVEGMGDPSIEALRRWLHSRLAKRIDAFKNVSVSIRGECSFNPTRMPVDESLNLPERIRFGFEAAHALPNLPETHKCFNMHGHSFIVEVAAGDLNAISPRLKAVYDALDHRCLNHIDGLENPTSEMIGRWIWDSLARDTSDLEVVNVAETCTARCIYHGQ